MIPTNNQDSLVTANNSARCLNQHDTEKIRRHSRITFKDESNINNNNIYLYPNNKYKNDLIKGNSNKPESNQLWINTLSNIDITLSPPTGTTTPPPPPPPPLNDNISTTSPLFNSSRLSSSSLLSSHEPPNVRVTYGRPASMENNNNQKEDDENRILKTGRVLCSKKTVWYTSRQQRHLKKQNQKYSSSSVTQHHQKEVQRQETYLTWREFRAVLKPHCLELYLVSPLLLHGPRLAHIIYFKYHHHHHRHHYQSTTINNKRPFMKTKWNPIFTYKKRKKKNPYPRFHQQWKQYQAQYKQRHQPKVSYLQLSLASLSDYTLKLEYENKTGGTNTFLLQGQNAMESQNWYMALYHLIPYKPHLLLKNGNSTKSHKVTKQPIPPFIDIHILLSSTTNHHTTTDEKTKNKKKKDNVSNSLTIRLPLDEAIDQDSYSTIQAIDLKNCLIDMINHFHTETQNNNNQHPYCLTKQEPTLNRSTLALCWRYNDRIEWIPDTSSIICPQLVEKKHVLELRTILPPVGQALEAPLSMEGFLIQSTNENGEFKKRHKQSKIYAMTEGHYLFLIDPSKAILPNQSERQKRGWSLNWLSAVTLMDLHQHKKENNHRNTHGLHERVNHLFQSVPGFFTHQHQHQQQHKSDINNENTNDSLLDINNNNNNNNEASPSMSTTATATTTSATSFELSRRSKQISYAYSVIDLSFIESVQTVRTNPINLPACSSSPTSSSPTYTNPIRNFSTSSNSSSSSFSIQDIHELNKRRKRLFELKLNDNTCIQFEATNAQAMFEWVHRLRKIIKYGHQCRLNGIIMSQAISNLWYCHIHKSILQSSILYVRKGSQKTYRRYLCVLSKGQGLMLYRYNKQHTTMTKKRMIRLNNKTTYAFGLNHALDLKSADGPTYMMTVDGERTRDQVHQCAFVIWQRSSFASDYSNYHYYITQIKEHVSLLKLGHRLGRKGDSFIFLASTVEEKDAWLWALHHEIDSSFSTSSSSPSSSTYH